MYIHVHVHVYILCALQGLEFEKVCVDIGKRRILWSISGHALPGHVLAVMGPTGKNYTVM